MNDRCYACGKRFRDPNNRQAAFLPDDGHASVLVGPECFRKIVKAAHQGYQPQSGGPRLFVEKRFAAMTAGGS